MTKHFAGSKQKHVQMTWNLTKNFKLSYMLKKILWYEKNAH